MNKQEILNRLFWLKLVCIRLDLKPLCEFLQDLHYTFAHAPDLEGHNAAVLKAYNQTCLRLVNCGIDYEKTLLEIMGQNHYQNYKQMQPDFGF